MKQLFELELEFDELAAGERGILLSKASIDYNDYKNKMRVFIGDCDLVQTSDPFSERILVPFHCTVVAHPMCHLTYLMVEIDFEEEERVKIYQLDKHSNNGINQTFSGEEGPSANWTLLNDDEKHINDDYKAQMLLDFPKDLNELPFTFFVAAHFQVKDSKSELPFKQRDSANLLAALK